MAENYTLLDTAISTSYVQLLIVGDDGGIPTTGNGRVLVSSSGAKKSCFEIGYVSCGVKDGAFDFDVASHDGTNGLKLGGTIVTSTAAEINYLDITAAGKTQASKSVVTDSNGDIQVPDSDKFNFGAGNDMALYHDGSNSYITNLTGILKLATETSGIAVTIGHTTSEVTVADNLTVTGTLASTGAATLSSLVCTAAATFGGGTGSSGATISTTGTGTFDGILKTEDTTEATSATDGSLQTDGGLSVAKDCVFGDDVKLLSDSAVLNMGAGNDVTLTHDGTTGGTLAGTPISINSTGDLTLDSTTDIVIDAAGGNVEFKDAGTLQLTLDMDGTGSAQVLKLGVNSDDLIFQQYDGYEVCRMADDRRLYFYDKGGEYISSDGTDLTIAAGDKVNVIAEVILTDTNVAHGVTGVAATDAYGDFGPIHSTYGGLYINGISDQENAGARSLALRGICNDTHTDTVPTVELIGAKRSGTSVQALASAETVLQVANHTTTLMTVLGSGSVGVGTVTPTTTLEITGGLLQQNVTLQSGTGAEDLTGTTGNLIWYATTTQAGDITLPQATSANAGMVIKIIAGANWSSTAFKLGYASGGSTVMLGTLRVSALDAVLTTSFAVTASSKNLVIDADAVATAGGAKGSTYTFTYLAANLVHVDANAYITTGTVATTAAASVTGGI